MDIFLIEFLDQPVKEMYDVVTSGISEKMM